MTEGTVRIDGNTLRLPGGVQVRFMRTLRLPETGTHALPPGLGEFPIRRVEDYADTVPAEWRARGGVMLPVYLREAMWLSFAGTSEPAALQVGVGKVCAVSGKPWSSRLARDPQNYVVLPRQPWLDGINSGKGTVRQFVAVPLGLGATVEGQVTGEEVWGGVQLQSFPLRDEELAAWREAERRRAEQAREMAPPPPGSGYGAAFPMAAAPAAPGAAPAPQGAAPAPAGAPPGRPRSAPAMGLGVGGSMRQEVYRDDRPLTSWAKTPAGRVFVHLVTPPEWRRITGEAPPPSPVDRAAYTRAGLPWFDYYDQDATDLAPTDTLGSVQPVGDWLGDDHEPWQQPSPHQVKPLGDAPGKPVEDGDW
ncbi:MULTISPECIES: hypothetical protein [Streptomyces]|uniref:Integral membrane protein n=1 Tax=Streptomyces dengpaensis TaxID=2049881 RepID=A0ABM6SKU2_9ACTN|nr:MULTISPECIES: hypothetical protein [Streptomyces]AVH55020.1 hypothetical protein C4B68_03505 [Streptomyces dengpaensis]PIB08315.1 hypothetical protein B1C81_15480 [Streptomyces sp. HG99]